VTGKMKKIKKKMEICNAEKKAVAKICLNSLEGNLGKNKTWIIRNTIGDKLLWSSKSVD
jgi:hypothetical protein